MGIREARKYITELHHRQEDPALWPDYLTGLPDKHAVIIKMDETYPKLGRYAVSYICITNLSTYLVKYGTDRHAEIIQWAAAILKTTADKFGGFVGTFGNHDFVAIFRAKDMNEFLDEASSLFEKRASTFYNEKDLKSGTVMSFDREGEKVNIGLMNLLSSTVAEKTNIPKTDLLTHLGQSCARRNGN